MRVCTRVCVCTRGCACVYVCACIRVCTRVCRILLKESPCARPPRGTFLALHGKYFPFVSIIHGHHLLCVVIMGVAVVENTISGKREVTCMCVAHV